MKKLALVAVVAAFGFASCKKDYTCACKVSGGSINAPLNGYKKKDATDACDKLETTYKANDASASCSLN